MTLFAAAAATVVPILRSGGGSRTDSSSADNGSAANGFAANGIGDRRFARHGCAGRRCSRRITVRRARPGGGIACRLLRRGQRHTR